MESETKFVPQWLQAKQNDSTSNGPSRGADRFFMAAGSRDRENGRLIGNGLRPNNPVKYQLAEHRYGREEMLALFDPSNTAPDDLSEHPVYVAEPLNPISFMPMTEEEEVLSLQNVNSYGYKPYLRGGTLRGGMRGDFGRGRGRGRDDEGRLKPRESWDDRPSKGHDYSGHDEGSTPSHKADFFSPSSHHSSFNRSNSNDSWRSRNNFQDADNGDYRKDRWPTKGWRDMKGENRLQEDGSFFKGASPRDQKPTDFRRSKSLYEEDETAHSTKMPEWSTVDKEDLGVEGSFDSSGAFMTSKLKEKNKKAQDDSVKNDSEPIPEIKSNPVKEDAAPKSPKSPPEAQPNTVLTREDDNNLKVNLPVASPPSPASSKAIAPVAKILPTVTPEETDQNVLFSNMKIDDPRASLIFHANDSMNLARNANVVASSFMHQIVQPASLPTAESGGILPHSPLVHPQPFNYVRNSWYYIDPQGATQGPFRDSDMAEWYYQGYFDMTLMLKAGEAGEFMTIGAFVSKVGSLPFAPNRPLVQSQPMQNLPQTPRTILNQHPAVSTLSHDVLPQTFFYPRQPLVPHLQQQHPMQSPEPTSNSFLPAMHLVATNAPNTLFASGSVHMPSLNGDIPNKVAWNQTQPPILQDTSLPEAAFNMLPQNATSLWNASLLPPSNNAINSHVLAHASAVQEKIQVDYHAVQQLEKLETDREQRRKAMDNEQLAMIEQMVVKKVLVDAKAQQKKERERNELPKHEETKLRDERSQRRIAEEVENKKKMDSQMKERHPDSMMLEMKRQEEGMNELRQQEARRVENFDDEEFKPVEDVKKLKENKKRKEAKKQEEAKRQEEIRRQEEAKLELMRKMEEQKKAEEKRKREEEEQILKMRLAAEEAKRKELEEMNLRKQTSSKNAWSAGRSQSSSKSGVPKINEIQNVEQEKMKQQLSEQKLIVEQQKQLAFTVAKTTGSIWNANTAKTTPPKSLLDIQMEQASQLEVPVKVQQQQPVAKVIEPHPPLAVSRVVTKESAARAQDAGKDSAWEAAVTLGLKKHQKPPTLDNNQFPALHSAKPSATGKKCPLKALGKSAKDEIAAQKVFEAVKVKDELTEWCEKSLAGLKTEVDISTLVDFLKSLKNSSEILEYIHNYLGDSKVVKDFAKQFVEKMNNYSQENNSWSVVGRQGNGSSKSTDKSGDKANKKAKKKSQKVDANFLLGFTVHADPHRTNAGEIDAVPSFGTKK